MKAGKCPLCGSDSTLSNVSSFSKRFWEIMTQVDAINQKEKTLELHSTVSDEEFKNIMTDDKIEIMKSLIDRHRKISL